MALLGEGSRTTPPARNLGKTELTRRFERSRLPRQRKPEYLSGLGRERGAGRMALPNEISDFIISVAEDPKKLEAFKNDPEAVLQTSGLSAEARTAIISSTSGGTLALGLLQPTVVVVVVVITILTREVGTT
jgi:hypothetical protein